MQKGVLLGRLQDLLAASAIFTVLLGPPLPVSARSPEEPQLAQAVQRTFDIPPQPLSSALPLFGQQSGGRYRPMPH